jgi:hypothetical protein
MQKVRALKSFSDGKRAVQIGEEIFLPTSLAIHACAVKKAEFVKDPPPADAPVEAAGGEEAERKSIKKK